MTEDFIKLFGRDLDKLAEEISLFKDEESLWIVQANITNSAGNLCLHLVGNLNTYIGKNLGDSGYIRNREAEFTSKNIPKDILLAKVKETKEAVIRILRSLDKSALTEFYKEDVLGYKMTVRYFLIYLQSHLSYHLGQINYLRRIIE